MSGRLSGLSSAIRLRTEHWGFIRELFAEQGDMSLNEAPARWAERGTALMIAIACIATLPGTGSRSKKTEHLIGQGHYTALSFAFPA